MTYKILLRERRGNLFVEIEMEFNKSSTYQKYFYSPHINEPHLLLYKDNEIKNIINLSPTIFKSGKSGYSGIDEFENFLIRANISDGETSEYKRLTVVTEQKFYSDDSKFNNYNNEENTNGANNNN